MIKVSTRASFSWTNGKATVYSNTQLAISSRWDKTISKQFNKFLCRWLILFFLSSFKQGLYKKGGRYGPGILKYADSNEEDVGYWHGDKLIRLLSALNVNFEFADIEQPDKQVEVSSWNDPDIMFVNEPDSNNMFLGRVMTIAAGKSLREANKNDPYIDKVLKQRQDLHVEYLKSLETILSSGMISKSSSNIDSSESSGLASTYPPSKLVEIKNLTKVLKEIFKYARKYDIFHDKMKKHLNIDLNEFELGKK